MRSPSVVLSICAAVVLGLGLASPGSARIAKSMSSQQGPAASTPLTVA